MQPQRLNLLWIISDQHNADCFGFAGRNLKTPYLDKLAQVGVSFERAYCNNPICAPSRASFITGQYPRTHRHLGNAVYTYPERNSNTISALARRNGYQTSLIGKAHMIGEWNREGFEYLRYCDLADADPDNPLTNHYFSYLCENGIVDWYDHGTLPNDHPGAKTQAFTSKIPHKHSLEVWTADETLKFLKNRDRKRPFFIQMSFERPHSPWSPSFDYPEVYKPEEIDIPENAADLFERGFATKPDFQQRFVKERGFYPYVPQDRRELQQILVNYYTLITIIDESIGRVISWLEENGMLKNTVIIYTSDHGDFAGEHGLLHKNLGIYESIHRIPFIIYYPGCPQGKKITEIIESVDLYPSLCQLLKIKPPERIEGKSFIPIIEKSTPGKEYALCEWGWFKPTAEIYAIRTKDFRFVYYGNDFEGELYDCRSDPGELVNLYGKEEYRKVRLDLTEKLFDYVKAYEKKTDMKSDLEYQRRNKNRLTLLIHKGGKRWSEVTEDKEP